MATSILHYRGFVGTDIKYDKKEEVLNMRKAYNKVCNIDSLDWFLHKKIQKNTIYPVDRMILLSYNLIKK